MRKAKTRFLNVDLDIYSRSDLQPILDAFGRKVIVLHAGRVEGERGYEAHIELSSSLKDADKTIRAFCVLIKSLRGTARDLWDGATDRDFNIGAQAEMQPDRYEMGIEAETVKAAGNVNARVVLTVYAPEAEAESSNG